MNKYCIEQLNKSHVKDNFNSGEDSLNKYLQKQATQDIKRNLSALYVLLEGQDSTILGYYTLCSSSVLIDSIPHEVSKKLPRYPLIPVTLLGRLAIDIKLQGQGLGELLLTDALLRAGRLSNELGSMAVIVDSLSSRASDFYEKFGFQKFIDKTNKLFLPMSIIKQLL
ncbi:GNAT family N-acetyltransferase [Legionella pneumophila serogroup 1]